MKTKNKAIHLYFLYCQQLVQPAARHSHCVAAGGAVHTGSGRVFLPGQSAVLPRGAHLSHALANGQLLSSDFPVNNLTLAAGMAYGAAQGFDLNHIAFLCRIDLAF